MGLVMTCADLESTFKPWEKSRKAADALYFQFNSRYEEFFQQGDQELGLGLRLSAELMDRAKMPDIPRMQVGFYKFIVVPAFDTLKDVFGKHVAELHESVKVNLAKWEDLRNNVNLTYKMGTD
jgi:3'5'-cyclic nucleotide phosphodiesterase